MANTPMTTRERILRAIHHQEADRIPMIDNAWGGSLAFCLKETSKKSHSVAIKYGTRVVK